MQLKLALTTALLSLVLFARLATADEPQKPRQQRGWGTIVDPDGDCKFDFGKGNLTLKIPGTVHGLGAERGEINAPRVLRDITGDFRVEVKVAADFPQGAESLLASRAPFHGAGLVAYADDDTNVRLERAELVLDGKNLSYASFELRNRGAWVRRGDTNELPLRPDLPTWLRLERSGKYIRGAVSQDGEKWIELDPVTTPLPKDLKVGVIAGHDTSSEFEVRFEKFKLSPAK